MKRLMILSALAIGMIALPVSHHGLKYALASVGGDGTNGECAVDSEFFASADGGCMDLTTGLVWSGTYEPTSDAGGFANRLTICRDWFVDGPEANGYTDWRNPTVGEVLDGIINGLNYHLDFSYEPGFQWDDGRYRLTGCKGKKSRGNPTVYKIRYSDGDHVALFESDVPVICVRGADPLPNSCPGDSSGGGGGKGGGKGKNK